MCLLDNVLNILTRKCPKCAYWTMSLIYLQENALNVLLDNVLNILTRKCPKCAYWTMSLVRLPDNVLNILTRKCPKCAYWTMSLVCLPENDLNMAACWLSGRVLVSRTRGCGFKSHWLHCVVSWNKTHKSSLVLIQPVYWDVRNQIKHSSKYSYLTMS